MLPNNTKIPIINPRNLHPQQRQPTAHMHKLTSQPHLRTPRHGPQIRDLEITTHPAQREVARRGHAQQDDGGEHVDERSRASAVQVTQEVTHFGSDAEEEGDFGGGPFCRGFEAHIAGLGVDVPALGGRVSSGLLCGEFF